MTKVNIFEAGKETEKASWADLKTPGSNVQGTYIGCILSQIDGYGNPQNIYSLLTEEGKVLQVGFNLNKKFIVSEMERVRFGQIIGFKYNGKVTVKNKLGKEVEVNDFSLFQDSKIVNEQWLKDNEGNMPVVIKSGDSGIAEAQKEVDEEYKNIDKEDVPFSSEGSITNEDKLAVITKLATDKLGATDESSVKEKVMEKTGIAFLPMNFDQIIEVLKA